MATAEELLGTVSSSEEILVVNLNTRIISIPTSLQVLGVESDDDVKRLQFKVPRYCGEFDLSTFSIQINFENAKGKGDLYPVDDLAVSDDEAYITFSWLVDRSAFLYSGDVKFSICMKLFDADGVVVKELNTTYATLPVLKGLETDKAVVENNPSAFDVVLHRLYAVEAATGNGQNGYYSVVKVVENDYGIVFTVVNQEGTTAATVMHGKDGTDGEDGYTPVKGVDYWTEADKVEAAEYAKAVADTLSAKASVITLAAADWSNNSQTVAVDGVTSDNIVFVSPTPTIDNVTKYSSYNVLCSEQSDGYLTFICGTTPTVDLSINVTIHHTTSSLENTSLTVIDDGEGNVTII